jgi:hypothetical protein
MEEHLERTVRRLEAVNRVLTVTVVILVVMVILNLP